jgi:DNA primase
MFPCADLRGRAVGFGARAMRENQQPKYLNTAEGELYHKREILYGVQVARAAAARAGEVILVEGYTDVLALQEAGLRNALGVMGTSLTEEQVGALQKIARVLILCLDADTAGQEAMVRAASLVGARKLELRVVPLPAGRDPADLVGLEGAAALRDRVQRAIPFADFQVQRIVERPDVRSAEGRDQAMRELLPIFASIPQGLLRDELARRVAGLLSLRSDQLAELLGRQERPARTEPSRSAVATRLESVDPAVRGERAFLALCLALPSAGEQALQAIDFDQHITSERLRRAARHLVGRLDHPLGGLPADDDDLARTVADLVKRAGQAGAVRPEHVEQQRLYLERARLERAIRRALTTSSVADGRPLRQGEGRDVQGLAREKEAVRAAIQELDARLERPV